jgi:hypothetical protein
MAPLLFFLQLYLYRFVHSLMINLLDAFGPTLLWHHGRSRETCYNVLNNVGKINRILFFRIFHGVEYIDISRNAVIDLIDSLEGSLRSTSCGGQCGMNQRQPP